jgi:hypothetical protein
MFTFLKKTITPYSTETAKKNIKAELDKLKTHAAEKKSESVVVATRAEQLKKQAETLTVQSVEASSLLDSVSSVVGK